MASEDDAAAFEPDLSLPPQPLEDSIWERLLEDAFLMDESDIPSSLVPDFDEETEELSLADTSVDFLVLDNDSDTSIIDDILGIDGFDEFETDLVFEEPDSSTEFPLDYE